MRTTKAITANCTVTAAFALQTYTVTASAGPGGVISLSGTVSAAFGATKAFTAVPSLGYKVSSMGSTCGGTLSSNTYTTKAITANCTVTAAFALATTYYITLATNSGGNLYPADAKSYPGMFVPVTSGMTQTFTVAPFHQGYSISMGGTCSGTLSSVVGPNNTYTYTTKPITANCTVTADFLSPQTTTYYTITASAGLGGSISPSGTVSVPLGEFKTFTITPNPGYNVYSLRSSCNGGVLGGIGPYITTLTNSKPCTVTATFSQTAPMVTITFKANGMGGGFSPSGPVKVPLRILYGFAVFSNSGYYVSSVNGCSITYGALSSGDSSGFTIVPSADCTVTATLAQQ
jgi:hypothetical protein